jgi:hypothetical protein
VHPTFAFIADATTRTTSERIVAHFNCNCHLSFYDCRQKQ